MKIQSGVSMQNNEELCEICGIAFKVESDAEKVVYICDNCKEEEEQGDESLAI